MKEKESIAGVWLGKLSENAGRRVGWKGATGRIRYQDKVRDVRVYECGGRLQRRSERIFDAESNLLALAAVSPTVVSNLSVAACQLAAHHDSCIPPCTTRQRQTPRNCRNSKLNVEGNVLTTHVHVQPIKRSSSRNRRKRPGTSISRIQRINTQYMYQGGQLNVHSNSGVEPTGVRRVDTGPVLDAPTLFHQSFRGRNSQSCRRYHQ